MSGVRGMGRLEGLQLKGYRVSLGVMKMPKLNYEGHTNDCAL